MLPGVEVARRRRVRAPQGRDLDAYDGGVGGAPAPAGSTGGVLGRAETQRSRLTVTVSSHHYHHHHHHHHHHHVHSRHGNPSSRPGTPRPGSLVRRMQDVLQELQEHRLHSALAASGSPSSDRVHVVETAISSHNHSSSSSNGSGSSSSGSNNRVFGHHRSGVQFREGHFASRLRRHASSTFSDLRGAALEARNRLDERLRAAAHESSNRFPELVRSRRNLAAVPADMNIYYSEDEDDNLWSEDDGWETSLHEWLAAWAPSVQESWPPWPRVDSSSSGRSQETWPSWPRVDVPSSSSGRSTPNSNSRSFKAKPSEGLSEAAINSLPLDVVGQNGSTGKLEQEDCPVCLEGVLPGQLVMTLPCQHRFHPECLTPWLSSHGQCPYCRAEVGKENSTADVKGGTLHEDEDHLSWVEIIERGMHRLSYS